MLNRFVIFLLMLFMTLGVYAQKKSIIAVTDLVSQGIDKTVAANISDKLRMELMALRIFRVMERSQMESILQEQGFQRSDACSSEECVVQMGQMLGAEQMIMGAVGIVGAMYTIVIRVIDVKTSEVLHVVSDECTCPLEEFYTRTPKSIAAKLQQIILKSQAGTLAITSNPTEAQIFLNNNFVGQTDFIDELCSPGTYTIDIKKNTYDSIHQQLLIEKGKKLQLSFALQRSQTYLDSCKKAQKHSRLTRKVIRQVVLGALTAGIFGAGVYFNGQAKNDIEKQNNAEVSYLTAQNNFSELYKQYESAREQTGKSLLYRNIFYSMAGGFLIAFGVTFIF
jgi:hypothetical protein